MNKIAVVGLGQMGSIYIKSLIRNFGFEPKDIIVYDIKRERVRTAVETFGVTPVTRLQDAACETAIVATNTPSHTRVIKRLAKFGTKWFFCEKPLGMTEKEALSLGRLNEARIFTAFLINFSPAIDALKEKMRESNTTILREASVVWGKNRFGNSRPTPGDLEDEAIHGFGALLQLIGVNGSAVGATVTARLTYMDYVDLKVQNEAWKRDASFPEQPNRSSYIMPEQVRRIEGILGGPPAIVSQWHDYPYLAFSIDFDVRTEDGAEDVLRMTDIRTGERSGATFKSDKIALELAAFLEAAQGGEIDDRLTDFHEAIRMVKFTDAVNASQRDDGRLKHAFGYHGAVQDSFRSRR